MLRGAHHHLLSILVDALTLINTNIGRYHQILDFPNVRTSKGLIAPIFYIDIVRRLSFPSLFYTNVCSLKLLTALQYDHVYWVWRSGTTFALRVTFPYQN